MIYVIKPYSFVFHRALCAFFVSFVTRFGHNDHNG